MGRAPIGELRSLPTGRALTSNFVLSHYKINHGTTGKSIIDKFHTVSELTTFKDYLQSIPGLYPKLVLWSIEHPFANEDLTPQKILHHAMPCFLYRTNVYGFKEDEIEVFYNLVSVTWIIHFVMHMIRAIEYGQTHNLISINIMLSNPSENIKKVFFL